MNSTEKINKKAEDRVMSAYQKVEDGVVGAYQKIEDGVTGAYEKVEYSVVSRFNEVSDKFVDRFFTKDGETVEEARERRKSPSADCVRAFVSGGYSARRTGELKCMLGQGTTPKMVCLPGSGGADTPELVFLQEIGGRNFAEI